MNPLETKIRYEWNEETCRWNYSIVDVIDEAIDTTDARNYWKVLKNRLKKRDDDIALSCNQLKMQARDGKMYNTDTADAHVIIKIIKVVSDSPLPHIESWVQIIESKIPQQKASVIALARKSFPQVRKLNTREVSRVLSRNRLKNFFSVK